ncbi:hypothetical protein OK349_13455 [Sphingomonas sp. BT-65]|uniref:hypothetical protein n=1 Tax=Sphingomonas sp. BT-65 TaxID=2989821 RepID=UPI002236695F|nr:hypothetical protein [Sphingomonas sp. BT-65]MCW4462717.1 hypothetical protein [Sphingomonas sp. BT-65]
MDTIGALRKFVTIGGGGDVTNLVDCAVASLGEGLLPSNEFIDESKNPILLSGLAATYPTRCFCSSRQLRFTFRFESCRVRHMPV